MIKIEAALDIHKRTIDEEKSVQSSERLTAMIDETKCIGCTKCVQLCPVDAIIGTVRAIHTVVADFCIGCNLCTPTCPTQCISLQPIKVFPDAPDS